MDRDETGATCIEIRIQTESEKYREGASETTFSEPPPPPYPGGSPLQEEGLANRRSSASASSQQGEPGERTSLSGSHHEATQVRCQGQTGSTQGESATDGGNRMGSEGTGFGLCCILVLVSIGALLTVILVPLGFSDLEYYEVSIVKQDEAEP